MRDAWCHTAGAMSSVSPPPPSQHSGTSLPPTKEVSPSQEVTQDCFLPPTPCGTVSPSVTAFPLFLHEQLLPVQPFFQPSQVRTEVYRSHLAQGAKTQSSGSLFLGKLSSQGQNRLCELWQRSLSADSLGGGRVESNGGCEGQGLWHNFLTGARRHSTGWC